MLCFQFSYFLCATKKGVGISIFTVPQYVVHFVLSFLYFLCATSKVVGISIFSVTRYVVHFVFSSCFFSLVFKDETWMNVGLNGIQQN